MHPAEEQNRPGRQEPGPRLYPDRSVDLDGLVDVDRETVEADTGRPIPGGLSGPIDVSGLLGTDDRARMVGGSEPNGWFVGPPGDPDRYQLLGPGLSGGEGDIWRARYRGRLTSPLQVAVKRLRRPAAMGEDWPTPADLRRWEDLRALLLIMRIEHLVSVLDVFVGPEPHPQDLPGRPQDRPTPYVVMEWVPGPTLADQYGGVPAGSSTLATRLRHVEEVAVALDALHSRTVSAGNPSLHRDVKPTNCILSPARGVVLVDVGTMRLVDDGHDVSGRHTPVYTAPEVLADPTAGRGPASDLYALGALAWFCLTGEDPPRAADPTTTASVVRRAMVAARNAGVREPAALANHLGRMMSYDPRDRPIDARAWAAQLRVLGAVRRPVSKSLVAAAVLMPVVAVLLVLLPLLLLKDDLSTERRRPGNDTVTRAAAPGDIASPETVTGRSGASSPVTVGPPSSGRPSPSSSVSPSPGEPVTTDVAAFHRPGNSTEITRCPLVTGTADLPPGQTLVFSVENLSVGDRIRHLTPIDGWQRPASLRTWRLRPPVGLPGDPLGERYRLEAIVVPLARFRTQQPGPFGPSIPDGSYVGASLFVSRGSQSDTGCPGLP